MLELKLLLKIKDALLSGIFLTPNFYEDSPLREFFDADAVDWLTKSTDLKGGNFHALAPDSRSEWRPYVSFKFTPRINSTSKSSVFLVLDGVSPFTLTDIEAVFGDGPTIAGAYDDPTFKNGHPWPISKATDPMGNKKISYDLKRSSSYEGRLQLQTDKNGKVNHISITQKES
jgi:hypothetical protein